LIGLAGASTAAGITGVTGSGRAGSSSDGVFGTTKRQVPCTVAVFLMRANQASQVDDPVRRTGLLRTVG
jgi:hypothetical protein